jgi:hypothetical protein
MKRLTSPGKILFDFRNATPAAGWQIVNDDVMGGVSASEFRLAQGIAVFSGRVSLANNGGFASVRSLPSQQSLSGCNAFMIRTCGDGRRYKFTVRTEPEFDSPLYQHAFVTIPGEWQESRLRFEHLVPTFRGRALIDAPPLDPARVISMGFLISDKQAGPFRLEIAWIKSVSLK